MNVSDIISTSLIEYDYANPIIEFLFNNCNFKIIKNDSDNIRNKIVFYKNNDNNKLLESDIEILAVYYHKYRIFSWAWSLTGLKNSENYLSKEILLYSLKLNSDLSYLKSILTTSRGIIKDIIQIDINLAISSNIIKQPYIYPYPHTIDGHLLVYYFILLNKDDIEKLYEKLKKNES